MKRSHAVAFDQNVTTVLLAVTQHLPHIPAAVPVAARLRTLSHWFRANAPFWPALSGSIIWTHTRLPLVIGNCDPNEHVSSVRWLTAVDADRYPRFALQEFAHRGANDILILLKRVFPSLSCWYTVVYTAAWAGQWDTVRLLVQLGVSIDNLVGVHAAGQGRLDMLQWLLVEGGMHFTPELTRVAAGQGHIHILEWITTNGYPRHTSAFSLAVTNRLFSVVDWLLQHGYSLTFEAYETAVISIRDDVVTCLEELRNRGCPLDGITCSLAIRYKNLAALKWLYEQGCPWEAYAIGLLAACGSVEMLDWAVAHGCPWDMDSIITEATINGNASLFAWALNHGWSVTDRIIAKVVSYGYTSVAQFLQRNKPPRQ